MKPILTIFTPTYNRADLLYKCYDSLKRQSCTDFLWMIIDDGSIDNTKEVVDSWINENNKFEIQYYYKQNGGLHTGYNEAIKYADTELMVCVDSDDYMTDDAVEKIILFWQKNKDIKYAGIVALDIFENGMVIGDRLPDLKTINLIKLLTNGYKIKNGDRKLVIRTDLYKKVAPMPSFGEEKNFNPHYMHLQISNDYDFLVMNEPLCVVEYQETGMSRNIMKQYLNSPKSFAQTRRLYMSLRGVSKKFIFKQCIHYVSSCRIAGDKNIIKESPKPLMTFFAYPIGFLLEKYIKYACK